MKSFIIELIRSQILKSTALLCLILHLLGLHAYFRPQWNKLGSIEIWVDAAKQIIFSLGPACGCVITLSSYNQFNRDCQKDAVVIAIANGLTSLFSGCVVFAILGYMAHEANKPVFEVVKVGSYCTNYLYNKLEHVQALQA